MATNHQTLRVLAKTVLSKLESRKYIVFNSAERNNLQDNLFKALLQSILTEEDINTRVRTELSRHSEQIQDANIMESDAFKSRKKQLKEDLLDRELNGLYFRASLREACGRIRDFLFNDELIEDVFESDENIQKLVMETIQGFDETKIA